MRSDSDASAPRLEPLQKLGLKAANLSTAFSSLSSSLATLRTETTGAKPGLTLRIGVQNEGPGGAESALDGGLISRQVRRGQR